MLFSTAHPCFVGDVGLGGNPAFMQSTTDSDHILLVGGRMAEIASQSYTLLNIPVPAQTLVHVHPDAQELNRVYRADLAINVSPIAFAESLEKLQPPAASPDCADELLRLRTSYLSWTDPQKIKHPGSLQMGQVMSYLRTALPDDAIMCNGAGNYATWLHRFHPFQRYGTTLAPTSGPLGYGLPARS